MCEAFGIVNYEGPNVLVKGMQDYRPVSAFSFLGRYRMIDFPISNLSNSGVDRLFFWLLIAITGISCYNLVRCFV